MFFVSGIGTGIGKTVVSSIITEALQADYWKPVQSGADPSTDSQWIADRLTNPYSTIHKEVYCLQMPASPHLAAAREGVEISIENICSKIPDYNRNLIVEGAGGLMVPLNHKEFIKDLIISLRAPLILVNRAYLGSINHSLLTAHVCHLFQIPVAGWIFNGCEERYEKEIVKWSGIPRLGSIPVVEDPGKSFVKAMAESLRDSLTSLL